MSAEMTILTNVKRRYSSAVTLFLVGTLFVSSQSQQESTCSFNIIAGEGNITTSTCSRRNSCTSQCRWNISSTMPENVITLSFSEDPNQGETPVEITFGDGCAEVPLREGFYYGTGYLLSYPVRPNVSMKMQSKSRCMIVTMDVRGVEDPRGIVVNYKEGAQLEDGFLRVENGHVITAHDHLGLDILKSDHVLYRDYEANITAMALHPWDKMLYIADDVTNTIRRYEVEAFDRPIRYVADIVTQGLGEVTGLAVDPSSGTVYWTDGVLNTISSVNHDGTSRKDIITTGLQYPDNLVLDHLQQTLYWTCNGVNKSTVESALTDGSNRKKVVTEESGPILIALEYQHTGSQVHWINTMTGKHGTIIGERSGRPFVSEEFENAASFSVSDKYWYYTKAGETHMYITKADEEWYTSLLPFYNMNIMLHYQTPELGATGSTCSFNIIAGEGNITTSTCSRRNSCTSQCRWNISSSMPENVITLSFSEDPNQGKTPVEFTFEDGCGVVPLREATYYGTGLLLSYPLRPNASMKMQSKSRCIIVTVHADGEIEDPSGIVVHYKEGKSVEDGFLRVERQSVITAHDHLGLHFRQSDYVLYADDDIYIKAMALHREDKLIYISDGISSTIRRYEFESFDKSIKYVDSIVTQGLSDVTSLAVDSVFGTVYWTDGVLNTISSVNHNGTSRRDVITTGLQHPNNIVVDHVQQTLYWTCEGYVFTVQRSFADGSNRMTLLTQYSGPILIALEFQNTGSEVYWINTFTGVYGTISGEQSRSHYTSEIFENATSFSVFDNYWYWIKGGEPYLYITKGGEDWYSSLGPFNDMANLVHYQTPENSVVKTPVLLPFGRGEGDRTLPPSDEGTSPPIYLSEGLVFFGRRFYRLYINTNGVISLNEGFATYYPRSFPFSLPEEEKSILIAPFYADADTRGLNGGTIYYRTLTPGNGKDLFHRLEGIINAEFYEHYSFTETNFQAEFLLLVTWDSISYFSKIEKSSNTNTFQVVLLSNQVETYVIFNYEDINWSTGVSPCSAADKDGTGGRHGEAAKVGFNFGDGQFGFMLNASGTDEVLNMDERSNIGIPGRWIFKIDGPEVEAPDEDVNVSKISLLLPFGRGEGDRTLPPSDEGSSSTTYLAMDLVFFGKVFYKVHVNTNGAISLNEQHPTFYPRSFPFSLPEGEESILIAPFYADADTTGPNSGNIYYRTETRDMDNDYQFYRLEKMIYANFYEYYPFNETKFEADSMFIVTWDAISYFSEIEKAPHTNTFQAVLLSDGVETYAFFNYEDIKWSTGVSPYSEANEDGTGGKYSSVAKVGFNFGDGQLGFMVNASGTDEVLDMDERSNMGIPGRWIFKIDGLEIEAPDEDVNVRCYEGWTYFDVEFACYKFIRDRLTWARASYRCKQEGGVESHLATITSPGENNFVAGAISRGVNTWIGGIRRAFNATELERKWITGEPWVYENFGQPPNYGGIAESCLSINFERPGLWKDHFCQTRKAFVCEMIPIVD